MRVGHNPSRRVDACGSCGWLRNDRHGRRVDRSGAVSVVAEQIDLRISADGQGDRVVVRDRWVVGIVGRGVRIDIDFCRSNTVSIVRFLDDVLARPTVDATTVSES